MNQKYFNGIGNYLRAEKENYEIDICTVQSNLHKTTYVLLFVLGTVFSQDEPIHDI